MSDYSYLKPFERGQTLFIFEGKNTEPELFEQLITVYPQLGINKYEIVNIQNGPIVLEESNISEYIKY